MADFDDTVPQNVPGKFYVDWSCIYCGLCDEMLPTVFREHAKTGWAFVYRQPATPAEEKLAREAADACPTDSIGVDGDLYDWNLPTNKERAEKAKAQPWWKFW